MNMHKNSLFSPKPLDSPNIPINFKQVKRLAKDRLLKINIICNHSEEDYKLYFSNKVNGKDTRTQIRTMINRILLLDQKVIHQGEIPLDVRGNLTKNSNMPNRIPKILNLYGIQYQENIIMKCRYKMNIMNIKNDLLRFFVIYKEDSLDIILIDPHHLVATEDYENAFKNARDYMRYDIADLRNSIFD